MKNWRFSTEMADISETVRDIGRWWLRNVNRKSWVDAGSTGIIFDDLEFHGHGILKSRISRRRCDSFQLYKAQL